MPVVPPQRPDNRLLAQLSAADYELLEPHLRAMEFPFKLVLYRGGQSVDWVYFPTNGVLSAVAFVGDTAVEVATVGDEGMVGLTAAFGETTAPNEILVQVAGAGYRMSAGALRSAARQGSALYDW